MRKNTPAKKGFSPFKENKNSSSNKPSQRTSASDRKRGDGDSTGRGPSKRGERPASTDRRRRDDDSARPDSRAGSRKERSFPTDRKSKDTDTFRPRNAGGDKSERSFPSDRKPRTTDSFRSRSADGDKPERSSAADRKPRNTDSFRSRGADGDKPERSSAADRKPRNIDSFRSRGADGDKPERSSAADRRGSDDDAPRTRTPRGAKTAEAPAAKRPERDENGKRRRIEPVRKTASGRTPFKPRPQGDDSAFHGASDRKGGSKRGSKDERSTPSGFNRKKYFDTANERFADKQDRKAPGRKSRHDEDAAPSGKKNAKKEESGNAPGEMPLNKYIAHSGLCSRRKAVDFVKEGKVTVNGKLVTEPAFKVTAKDDVAISNKRISIQKNLVYILLNKPKGYITTTDDPEGRKTVMELIEDATSEEQRVYPVGRLDRNTSGLLLLTNDGELAQKLAHPKHNIKKIYHVGLNKPLTKADFDRILQGVTLEDGVAHVDALGYVESNDKTQVGIEIHSGKNRIVRRIFEHLEYEVEKLDRVTYAGLTKKNINRGKWRFLTEKEIILLKHFK
jgi:23S rRNA pseudouridine2605 synthase